VEWSCHPKRDLATRAAFQPCGLEIPQLRRNDVKTASRTSLPTIAGGDPARAGIWCRHFANTSREYPPKTLAVNGKLILESSHRGTLATAFLIDGCCLKSPTAAFV
jgi:hypothetical protein